MTISNPTQTALVTCRGKAVVLGRNVKKDNIITVDWYMPISFEPSLYAVAIGRKRFSQEIIHSSAVFCINFVPYELSEQARFCGTNRGELLDKFAATKLTSVQCSKIDCPRIGEALAYLECKVIKEFEVGDHILFIGQVVEAIETRKGKRLIHLDGDKFTTTVD